MGFEKNIATVLSAVAISLAAGGVAAQDSTPTADFSNVFGQDVSVTEVGAGNLSTISQLLGSDFPTVDSWVEQANATLNENGGIQNLDPETFNRLTSGQFTATENFYYSNIEFSSTEQLYQLYKLKVIARNLTFHNPEFSYELGHTRFSYITTTGETKIVVGAITIISNDPSFYTMGNIDMALSESPDLNLQIRGNLALAQAIPHLGEPQGSFPLSRNSTLWAVGGYGDAIIDTNDMFYHLDSDGQVTPMLVRGTTIPWRISTSPQLSLVLNTPDQMIAKVDDVLDSIQGACAFLNAATYSAAEEMHEFRFVITYQNEAGDRQNYRISICSYNQDTEPGDIDIRSYIQNLTFANSQLNDFIKQDLQGRVSYEVGDNGMLIEIPNHGRIQLDGITQNGNYADSLIILGLVNNDLASQLNEDEIYWTVGKIIGGIGLLALIYSGVVVYPRRQEAIRQENQKQEMLTNKINNIASRITTVMNGEIFANMEDILKFEGEVAEFSKMLKEPELGLELTPLEVRIVESITKRLPVDEDGLPFYSSEQIEQKVRDLRSYDPKYPSKSKTNNIVREVLTSYFDEIRKKVEDIQLDTVLDPQSKNSEILNLTKQYEYQKAILIKHFEDKGISDGVSNFNTIFNLTAGAIRVPVENPIDILNKQGIVKTPDILKSYYRRREITKTELLDEAKSPIENTVLNTVNAVGNHLIDIITGTSAEIDKIKKSHKLDEQANLLKDQNAATLRKKASDYVAKAIAGRILDNKLPLITSFADDFALKQNAEEIAREIYNYCAGIKSNKQEISTSTTFNNAFPYYAIRDLTQELVRMNKTQAGAERNHYFDFNSKDANIRSINTSNNTRLYIVPIYKYDSNGKQQEVVKYHMVVGPHIHNSAG